MITVRARQLNSMLRYIEPVYVYPPFGMQIVTRATHKGMWKSNLLSYLMPLEVPVMCHKLGKRGGDTQFTVRIRVTQ